jgi:hypothetical protein
MFKEKLSNLNGWSVEELLEENDHVEKLLLTYQVILDTYFSDRGCEASIAF